MRVKILKNIEMMVFYVKFVGSIHSIATEVDAPDEVKVLR
ncbi:hypothetical protein EDD80_10743 [Anseongella ginsenosidimutans]|uniref:Uncharacterized protein n=1 Tax=Anseongella ginsenosidimutans TaxID=496056 RepID=A0A4R3KPE1_9SPHI|nr:hypothetical protein EDD80_10743 [Anseongella ginsenosidimutans]